MTREEYMTKLQKYLRKLPKQDYEDAIEYFNEYLVIQMRRSAETDGGAWNSEGSGCGLMYNLLDRKIQEQDESGEEKKSKKGITLLAVLAIMSTPCDSSTFYRNACSASGGSICVVCVIFSDFIVAFSILLVGWQAVAQRTCFLPVFFIGCTDDHRMWVTWNWMRNPAVSSWNLSLQMDWYASCYACTENSWKEG